MNQVKPLHILHLEDDSRDAELVRGVLRRGDLADAVVQLAATRAEFLAAMEAGGFDVILSDTEVPGIDGVEALQIARQKYPGIPFLFVSGHSQEAGRVATLRAAGASDCLLKSQTGQLAEAIQRAVHASAVRQNAGPGEHYLHAMERLVTVVQELSLARDLDTIMKIVRQAARELTEADGATFVLRDNGMCFYADEDAISPLWKGQRFPMSACISGWAMLNRQPAVIEDIYADSRIPQDAYRPTFVKSLTMVPIRTLDPIGAIGNYWATPHRATPEEVRLLQALADTTAVALENVQVYTELEQRVKDRTAELETANKELEAFSSAVSHDLRAPVRQIDGFAQMLAQDCANKLGEDGLHYLNRMSEAARRMGQLIEDLLALSRTTQMPVARQQVDITLLAREVAAEQAAAARTRQVDLIVADGLAAQGDARLLRVVLENLLSNAWKYTGKCARSRIEVGSMTAADGQTAFYVRDNGAGFDMAHASKLFGVFQRLHSEKEFPGTGIGLATVQRIIHKHGGKIWAEAEVGRGACFYFTLG